MTVLLGIINAAWKLGRATPQCAVSYCKFVTAKDFGSSTEYSCSVALSISVLRDHELTINLALSNADLKKLLQDKSVKCPKPPKKEKLINALVSHLCALAVFLHMRLSFHVSAQFRFFVACSPGHKRLQDEVESFRKAPKPTPGHIAVAIAPDAVKKEVPIKREPVEGPKPANMAIAQPSAAAPSRADGPRINEGAAAPPANNNADEAPEDNAGDTLPFEFLQLATPVAKNRRAARATQDKYLDCDVAVPTILFKKMRQAAEKSPRPPLFAICGVTAVKHYKHTRQTLKGAVIGRLAEDMTEFWHLCRKQLGGDASPAGAVVVFEEDDLDAAQAT